MEVVRIGKERYGEASDVLARAFFDDPAWVWLLPDAQRRARLLPWLFRIGFDVTAADVYATVGPLLGAPRPRRGGPAAPARGVGRAPAARAAPAPAPRAAGRRRAPAAGAGRRGARPRGGGGGGGAGARGGGAGGGGPRGGGRGGG